MRILVTNDDGVYAPGIRALWRAAARLGEPWLVGPAEEQSGVGHSITIKAPLLVEELYEDGRLIGWAVDGSPADSVKLACLELIRPAPEIVISGINSGYNAGINVLYSGTVAAAIEGAYLGKTAFAVSLEYAARADYELAAQIAVNVIDAILRHDPPRASLFNINIPDLDRGLPAGVRVVRQSTKRFEERFERRIDPRGRTYFWPPAEIALNEDDIGTDLGALKQGYVTVTPLRFDLTAHEQLDTWQQWEEELSESIPHES